MLAGVVLISCSDRKEELQAQIQNNITVVERNVQALEHGRLARQARLHQLETQLVAMELELAQGDRRIEVAGKGVVYLRELTTVGFGESAGSWVLRNPASSTNLFLFLGLCLVIWLLYRIHRQKFEREMMVQIDGVIQRLAAETPVPKPPPRPEPPRVIIPEPTIPEPAAPPRPRPAPVPEARSKPGPPAVAARPPEKETPPAVKPKPKDKDRAAPAVTSPAPEKTPPAKVGKAPAAKKPGDKKEKTAKTPARKKAPRRPQAKKCQVAGCNNKHRSKGLCNKHYQQWRKGLLTERMEE